MHRTVFFISDRTGITVETMGHSLLSQFDDAEFEQINLPFVDNADKAKRAIEQVNDCARRSTERPIVFSSLIDPTIRQAIEGGVQAAFFDFFQTFLGPLEKEFAMTSSHTVGRTHGMVDNSIYNVRMEAVNFALTNDDGSITKNYNQADLIVVGVSRSGKTPTCLYLALQFGIRAANYPLTEEDLQSSHLPNILQVHRHKLYGLTINPDRLQKIRHERRPDSPYSSLRQCQYELRQAEAIFRAERVHHLNSTTMSVEEIATTILAATGIKRRLY